MICFRNSKSSKAIYFFSEILKLRFFKKKTFFSVYSFSTCWLCFVFDNLIILFVDQSKSMSTRLCIAQREETEEWGREGPVVPEAGWGWY